MHTYIYIHRHIQTYLDEHRLEESQRRIGSLRFARVERHPADLGTQFHRTESARGWGGGGGGGSSEFIYIYRYTHTYIHIYIYMHVYIYTYGESDTQLTSAPSSIGLKIQAGEITQMRNIYICIPLDACMRIHIYRKRHPYELGPQLHRAKSVRGGGSCSDFIYIHIYTYMHVCIYTYI